MFGAGAQWGYYSDSETGRLLLTSRYYDPGTGRFLTRDPIGYAGGINLYAYCGNGPVGSADPLGLEGEETGCPGEPGVFDPSPAALEGNEDPMQEVETEAGAPVVEPQFPATAGALAAEGVRLDPSVFRTLGEPVPIDPQEGIGRFEDVGGHHIHAKSAFRGDPNYDLDDALAISHEYMQDNGYNHLRMTPRQQQLFLELGQSGAPNTMKEHNRIAVEALVAGNVGRAEDRSLVAASLRNLRAQGVRAPTRIPWVTK